MNEKTSNATDPNPQNLSKSIADMLEEQWLLAHIPAWATGRTDGELVLGAQLPTRDGRRMGNAHIVEIGQSKYIKEATTVYLILTDAGNSMVMLEAEVKDAFWPPQWVSNVPDVIAKFWREPTPLTL